MVHIKYEELEFTFVRSRGPGGQNVNKTNSAAQMRWNVLSSSSITDDQKSEVFKKLERLLVDGIFLIFRSDTFRDQDRNKSECIRKLTLLLEKTLKKEKKRIPSKPTRSSVRKRLDGKKKSSETKKMRGKINSDY